MLPLSFCLSHAKARRALHLGRPSVPKQNRHGIYRCLLDESTDAVFDHMDVSTVEIDDPTSLSQAQ